MGANFAMERSIEFRLLGFYTLWLNTAFFYGLRVVFLRRLLSGRRI